ncbi:ABC transporter permease [Microbacterium album]|uniref:ABC transporter permease n=2 Tax=Microbacterium album TaxID=2053191 RepID=A0A917ID59_9MICO|nr:ABC transporter permease [Microbacterium album]
MHTIARSRSRDGSGISVADRVPPVSSPRAAAPRRSWGRRDVLLWQGLTAVLLIGAWALGWAGEVLPRALLPAPWEVLVAGAGLITTAPFWAALGSTLLAAVMGLLISVAIGVPLGLIMGLAPAAYRSSLLIIDVGRSFPSIALLPVLILVIGTTVEMKVFVIVSGIVWPILLQTYYGARRVDPVVNDTVRSYRIPPLLHFAKVLLPNAAPFAVTGIRIAASAAILIALGVEVLTLNPGMGGNLARAQTDGAPALALAYLVYAGLLGWILYRALTFVEDRLLVWNRRGKGGAR